MSNKHTLFLRNQNKQRNRLLYRPVTTGSDLYPKWVRRLWPCFYAAAWDTIGEKVMNFVPTLGEADLEPLNRAYVVLLPKKAGAVTPEIFRPIYFQRTAP